MFRDWQDSYSCQSSSFFKRTSLFPTAVVWTSGRSLYSCGACSHWAFFWWAQMNALQGTRKDFVLEKKSLYHYFSNISSGTCFWREVKALPDCVVRPSTPGGVSRNIQAWVFARRDPGKHPLRMLASREPLDQKWSHTCVSWSGYIDHECPMPTEARRGAWVSWNWNHRSLWVAMCLLGIKPGSSRRVASKYI